MALAPGVLLAVLVLGRGLESVLDDLGENGLQVVLLVDLERSALLAGLQVDAERGDAADGLNLMRGWGVGRGELI